MAELGTDTGTEIQAGAEGQDEAARAAAEEAAGDTGTQEGETGQEETGDTGTQDGEEPGKAKTEPGVQRKIDKEVGRRKRAEEETAYWRGRHDSLMESMGKGGKKDESEQAAIDTAALEADYTRQNPEPQESDFTGNGLSADEAWRKFNTAHTRWAMGLESHIQREQGEARTRHERNAEDTKTLREAYETQRDAGEEEFENFSAVVSKVELPVSALHAIYRTQGGHRIIYYLAQNPTEQKRISELNPYNQAKEIGKLEAKIETGAIQLTKTTKAPPPPSTLDGKGGTQNKNYFDENMSTEDRIAMSRERQAQARGK